jgi:hypothetical protein
MLFELVKNSLRAVNDRFENDDSDAEAPPVRLVVAEGDEDITLKVSDEGGGIPRSGLPRIWTYLYSTARSPLDDMEKEGEGDDGPAVLGKKKEREEREKRESDDDDEEEEEEEEEQKTHFLFFPTFPSSSPTILNSRLRLRPPDLEALRAVLWRGPADHLDGR